MRPFLYILCLILVFPCLADSPTDIFTIYLVRHAEKQSDKENPSLTDCGTQRAEGLARLLSSVKLEHVYSTNYERTLSTATPVAESQNLEIELYAPRDLEKIKRVLLNNRQDALVVGHGNTTAVLAGMLAGQELAETRYRSYDRIYQVVIFNNVGRVHLLHDTFECSL